MMARRRLPFFRYLTVSVIAASAVCGLYVALFFFQLGPFVPADYWIREAFIIKEHLAKEAEGRPRILIMGGSGSLFGIDSGLIQHETGMRTVNLAIHGGLGFDFMAKQTLRVVKPGDVVLAPLEPNLIQLPILEQWFANNIMTWGGWYFDSLSVLEKARFLFAVDPVRVVAGGLNRYFDDRLLEELRLARRSPAEKIIADMEKTWAAGSQPETPLSFYEQMNRNGDVEISRGSNREFKAYHRGYLEGDARVRPEFVRRFTAFRNELQEMDARVILLWPATMTDEAFDLSRETDREAVAAFEKNLGRHGIYVVGSPFDSHFPRELFYDSNFHLNTKGREIRTSRLVQLLKREVPDLFSKASSEPQTSGQQP